MKNDENGDPLIYRSTGFHIIIPDSDITSVQEIVTPMKSILRKVIVCCNPCEPQESIVIDFECKGSPWSGNDVILAFYPQEGGMVRITKVVKVYVDIQIAKVIYYKKTGEKEDTDGI